MIKAATAGKLALAAAYQGTDPRGGPARATVKVDRKIVKQ
jgi:hypothetical protein